MCLNGRQCVIDDPTGSQFQWEAGTSLPPDPRLGARHPRHATLIQCPPKSCACDAYDASIYRPVSHDMTRLCPMSPAAQLAALKLDIVLYTTSAAWGITSSEVLSASPTGTPRRTRPTDTGGGTTRAVLDGNSTNPTANTSTRCRPPTKQRMKQPPPKPKLAAHLPLPVISRGKGLILFSLKGQDREDTSSRR